MHPTISISAIVATYNREASLVPCLSSVINQDWDGPMEIILVDQTQQHTHELLDFFRLHERRIIRIVQKEPNLPKARNAGIAAARGEILLFVDDDIILPPHAVRRLGEHFAVSRGKGVTGLVVSESNAEGSLRAYAQQFGVACLDELRQPREVDGFIGALMMVSAEAVSAVGGFDPNLGRLTPTAYGEDDDFCCRLWQAGIALWIDPTVRVLHKDYLPGGCESRKTDPRLALKYHMKSMVYISIKTHGRMGAKGWLRLARGYIVNRHILRESPGQFVRKFAIARSAVKEVRNFMALDRKRDGMGASLWRGLGLGSRNDESGGLTHLE